MPKRIPVEAKRVPLNCLVLPETMAWLRSVEGSQGGAVDLAVAALRTRASFNTPLPSQTVLDDTATIRAFVDVSKKLSGWDGLIAEARDQIKDLERAIEHFESNKAKGEPYFGKQDGKSGELPTVTEGR